jgi:hypothetical protein
MAIEGKSTLTVAAAFAAAMLAAPASQASTAAASEPVIDTIAVDSSPQPSPAALHRLEEAAQVAWIFWPRLPPKFADIWLEVTHVETIRTA